MLVGTLWQMGQVQTTQLVPQLKLSSQTLRCMQSGPQILTPSLTIQILLLQEQFRLHKVILQVEQPLLFLETLALSHEPDTHFLVGIQRQMVLEPLIPLRNPPW